MIDFRFHLISIIAVLLALSLGILVGSGFLGDPLLEDLRARADSVTEANERLRSRVEELRTRVAEEEEFAAQVEPLLTRGQLSGDRIMMFVPDGVEQGLIADVEEQLLAAGASMAATIRFEERFSLSTVADREQLALILRSVLDDAAELRAETGSQLGSAAAAIAGLPQLDETRRLPREAARLAPLLDELEEADFISIRAEDRARVVPSGATFLVVAGAVDPPPFDAVDLVMSLAENIARGGSGVVVAEPTLSRWGVVTALRDGGEVAQMVASVDHADTVAGHVAIVLGLDQADRGVVGHYGVGPGATGLVPAPPPSG